MARALITRRDGNIAEVLTYAPPIAAVVLVGAAAIFGHARALPWITIQGAPGAEPSTLSLYANVFDQERNGPPTTAPDFPLELDIAQPRGNAVAVAATDKRGELFATIGPAGLVPMPPELDIVASDARMSRELAHARVPFPLPEWSRSFAEHDPNIRAACKGSLDVKIEWARGQAVVAFDDDLIITVTHHESDRPFPGASVTLDGDGITIQVPPAAQTDSTGRVRTTVRAIDLAPNLDVHVTGPLGEPGNCAAQIQPVAGGMWIDPKQAAAGKLVVRSPVAHRHAYVTAYTRRGVLFSRRLDLVGDAIGGGQATIPLELHGTEPTWVEASPDPPGHTSVAVGWPVRGVDDGTAKPSASMRFSLMVDSSGTAERFAQRQVRRVRTTAIVILASAALLQAIVFSWRARADANQLRRALGDEVGTDAAERITQMRTPRWWLRLVIAAVLVSLGLFGVALLLWMTTG